MHAKATASAAVGPEQRAPGGGGNAAAAAAACKMLQHPHAFASLNWLAAFSYISAASSYLLPPNKLKALSRLSALATSSCALLA